jgi:hypothetical protein
MFVFLHGFIGWLGRETRYRLADRSADVLRIVSGALFLGSSDSVQPCQRFVEGCHVQGPPQEAYVGRTWTGVGSVRVVLVGFSLAGCTSIQITATLGYE